MHNSIATTRPAPAGPMSSISNRFMFWARRLNRRRLMALALALVAALITRQAIVRAAAVEEGLGVRQPVVVALADIAPGTILGTDHTHIEMWPVDLVPAHSMGDQTLTFGLTVRSAIGSGEAVVLTRVEPGNLGLAATEVGVTLSQPLARPPLVLGQIVQLVGVRGVGDQYLATASLLGTGRIVSFTEDELTVAVGSRQMPQILEHAAIGTVEIVITPQRG